MDTGEAGGLLGYQVRISESVVFRDFARETVLLDLKSGRYFGLNVTAGQMLKMLNDGGKPAEVAAAVAAQVGVDRERVAQDLDDLCRRLADRGLVQLEPAG